MWTAVTVAACAALLALDAGADAPVPAAPDMQAEIAWARANWPGFEGLHFHAPLAKLRAWVARGPVPVYLFNDDFACRAATLFPYGAWRGDDAEARARQDDDASAPRPMTAKIVGRVSRRGRPPPSRGHICHRRPGALERGWLGA